MTTSMRQSVIFFLLLLLANFCSGAFNLTHHYNGSISDAIETIPGLIVCSFIFWIGCQWRPKTKFRLFLLPSIRILFWSIILLYGILNKSRMYSEDLLYAVNELFFWWKSLKILTPEIRNYNEFIELFFVDIISIAIGQFLISYSTLLIDRIIVKQKSRVSTNCDSK